MSSAGVATGIAPAAWLEEAINGGATLWSGVPCSYLKSLIDCVISHPRLRYVPAANEGDAVSVAAGAWLGGGLGVALMQNSGLGNAVNPLTSLLQAFSIPMVLLVTWRGQPGGPPDEPQHELMGRITPELLDSMEIPWQELPAEPQAACAALRSSVERALAESRPCALLIPSGRFAASPATAPFAAGPRITPALPDVSAQATRAELLTGLLQGLPDSDLVVATTGYTGRELYALGDRPQQLYMVGAMGCASSLALGLALQQPNRRVWVLDGDGALLMRLGALSTLGFERPSNLMHLALDNRCHESTGAQATVSASVDLPAVAAACGYPRVLRCSTPGELRALAAAPSDTLTFVHCPMKPGVAASLPRPKETPQQVARRFRAAATTSS